MTLRSILTATDFSTDATHACWRAAELASEWGADLRLLHVVEPDTAATLRHWLDPGHDYASAMAEQAQIMLATQAEQIRQTHTVRVTEHVEPGHRIARIRAVAADAALIVLGAHGFHPMPDFIVGSTADRLVRSADRPILVVKRAPSGPYRTGLVLTDFSPGADAALRDASALAPQAALHLLHAIEVPYEGKLRFAGVEAGAVSRHRDLARHEAEARLLAQARSVPEPTRIATHAEFGDPRVAAIQRIEQLQPDFVAVGKQGQSLLQDLFLGSTTAWMLSLSPCDVLVVPQAATSSAT